MPDSSVVAYCTRTHSIMVLNLMKSNFLLFYVASILLFHVIQLDTVPTCCTFRNSITIYCMALYLSGATVDATSQVHSSVLTVQSIVRNWKVLFWDRLWRHNVHTKSHPNRPVDLELNRADGQTDKISLVCTSCK